MQRLGRARQRAGLDQRQNEAKIIPLQACVFLHVAHARPALLHDRLGSDGAP